MAPTVVLMAAWSDILDAVGRSQTGDREAGRAALLACWKQTASDDHAQRCVLAHYLADTEPVLEDEVRWDERALAEFAHVADADLAPVGIPAVAGLAPSLHLNLGDGYLRQGRTADADRQLRRGQKAVAVLGEDGYAAMVRRGLAGLEDRVREAYRSSL
jgi:hypothetical protein